MGGVAALQGAIFGRSVCTLHFSTNDERHIPTNGLAWQTRTAGMGEEACLHVALRARHDLHLAIGWWDAMERVVNGVDCVIVVSIIPRINVVVNGRLPRKAIHQIFTAKMLTDNARTHQGGRSAGPTSLAFLEP